MKFKIFTEIFQVFKDTRFPHPKKKVETAKSTPNTEEFERCVMCGALTSVPISMPIDWRENYEVGCGQICNKCAKKRQEAGEYKNTPTVTQILQIVEYSEKENDK